MAKKKEPTAEDAVAYFKEVMNRANITEFPFINNIVYTKNAKEVPLMLIFDQTLWNLLLSDESLKDHFKEIDISTVEGCQIKEKMKYAEGLDDDTWVEINPDTMYNGDMTNIEIEGFNYEIPVNKGLFPIRLKKAEFNNFAYRVLFQPDVSLTIKKKFNPIIENTSFTLIRAFKIL